MRKVDYNNIAMAINEVVREDCTSDRKSTIIINAIVENIAKVFKKDNGNFNIEQFYSAVYKNGSKKLN